MKKYITFALFTLCLPFSAIAAPVWIDVRPATMHEKNGIKGDLNIPVNEIAEKLADSKALTEGKDSEIHLYCNSGYTASLAKEALEKAGYSNASNAGGVEDAKKQRSVEICCLD